MHKSNPGCGNGVTGILFVNDVEKDRKAIQANDTTGITRVVITTLAPGDSVDLALTPFGADNDGQDGCDGSENWLQVTTEPPDADQDGKIDPVDNCPSIANPGQEDGDGDGVGNVCDNCPSAANTTQDDRNADGVGDACDDEDGDTVVDAADNCPDTPNASQANGDADALGDSCDNCPAVTNAGQEDRDRDGVGDLCEPPAIADSFDDWSVQGTQGEKNWFYGYYNLTADQTAGDGVYGAADFLELFNDGSGIVSDLNQWGGDHWRLAPDAGATGGPWTFLGRGDTHPNGTNSTPNEEHWTVLRWESDRAGKLAISWHLREVNLGGTGVSGYLFVNDELADSAVVPGGDAVGVKRTVARDVAIGDTIDLACGPQGDMFCSDATDPSDGADGSFFILRISDVLPPPPPGPPVVIASSEADWSLTGTQGEKGWSYGYYDVRKDYAPLGGNKKYEVKDFKEFLNDGSNVTSTDPVFGGWKSSPNHWSGGHWDLLNNGTPQTQHGPWTELTCAGGHPAANAQGDTEVQWTMRRWVSTYSGSARITGYLLCPAPCGDGTVGRIFLNGSQIHAAHSQGAGVRYLVSTSLSVGDVLDFAIDPDGAGVLDPANLASVNQVNDGCDTAIFTAAITTPPTESCSNGVEDDGDGLIDCADPDCAASPDCARERLLRGDADLNGTLQLTDAVQILGYLFLGVNGRVPECLDGADADDNGQLQLTDAVRILGFLFLGGAPPAPPFPDCGSDPAEPTDDLDCPTSNPSC
ncbi:MAG: thrombospondin type 3 repeat-containing protein [Planctomycetes bacterium]|nr:thrombospondin type 3 repeat-containing protein [Planctomycetota bacterium]